MAEWWVCPLCQRQFGRNRQGHECAPAMTIDEYFADLPAFHREVHDAVVEYLRDEGDIRVEHVAVGVLIKHGRTIVELRPMRDWLALSFVLPRVVKHPRITRTTRWNDNASHAIRVRSISDIDDQVREWLSEAMSASGW